MDLMTISEVSKGFNVSTRTLRYYEQIGLLRSVKKDDYAYRTYEVAMVARLQQIILLRKLRIPLKQIVTVLESADTAEIIGTLQQNLSEVDDEITALSTIRTILNTFITRLNENAKTDIKLNLLDDISVLDIADSLTVTKISFKDERDMADLNAANEKLNRLSDRDVRIVYIPPATVAAAHYIGDEPEHGAMEMLFGFINKSDLAEVFPAARCFGFNHPNPDMREDGKYGYEFQVTIPDGMDVPAPMAKKRLKGGLYAAYMILMDEINGVGWNRLYNGWLTGHETWEENTDPTGENMNGLLEEHLYIWDWQAENHLHQVDLLMPVKRKQI